MPGTKKQIGVIVMAMMLVFLIVGYVSAAGGGSRIVAQPRKGDQVTIQQLENDFAKYNVYYSGIKPSEAVAILFCPKEGNTTLKPDRWWEKVPDQKALSNTISWMQSGANINIPTVRIVRGPNSQVFGYVFAYLFQFKTKVISEKEVLIYAPVN